MTEAAKIWRKSNPAKVKAQNARYRLKLKLDVLTHYAGTKPSCYCCGESVIQFLGIDHMDNDGVAERKGMGGGHAFYRRLKSAGYPEANYKVACQNCNSTRYYYGQCPHQQMVLYENPLEYLARFLEDTNV